MKKSGLFTLLVLSALCVFSITACTSVQRSMKSFSSDMSGGLYREIIVYDAEGEILFQQEGRFDIEYDEAAGRILYDDDQGMRHLIYLGSGTVIVNEKDEPVSSDKNNSAGDNSINQDNASS